MLKWYELFMSIYLSTIKNELFFNVRIACLLNTAGKKRVFSWLLFTDI